MSLCLLKVNFSGLHFKATVIESISLRDQSVLSPSNLRLPFTL